MRAHKGDEIVCKCGQPAGFFDRDVEDRASISSSHIVLTAPPRRSPLSCLLSVR